MKVKYLDLQAQFNDEALWAAIKKQLKTCQFILGAEVERFETNFAKLCQTPFALGLNSGTDALFLALKALSIGPGDEVITAPNSFIATTGVIVAAGAKPVFVDVDDEYNINVDLIEKAVGDKTRAILPVHMTGNPANMSAIMEIADAKRLFVVEDAAQAVGATIDGHPVGSFGDAGCFSLHPLKNLNVGGDGGVLTTRSEEIFDKVKLLRNHGLKNRDEIECFGYNSRLDSLQAAIANQVMMNLDEITQKRQENAKIYNQELRDMEDFVRMPKQRMGVMPVYHTYVVQVTQRTELIKYLQERGIEIKIHYPIPNHLQVPSRKFGYKKGDFPVCERQAESILSLPIHQHLTDDQIHYVTDAIKAFYQR